MAFVIKDRVRENSASTGTGPFSLSGVVAGYQRFNAVCSVADTCWYTIVLSATSWETGIGTYSSANTLTRTTVLESSNANAAVDFAAGTKDVFIGFPSSKMAGLFDATGLADQVRWNTAQSLTTGQKNQARSNIGFVDNPTGGFTAGDVKLTYKTAADNGWVMMNDGTIGSAASGASTRANADTADAFAVIWAIGSAAAIPILTSTGTASTYGANAAADFAANKRLTLPRTLGRSLAGAGTGSGLTARLPGTTVGVETVTLTNSQIPANIPNSASSSASSSTTISGGTLGLTESNGLDSGGLTSGTGPASIIASTSTSVSTTVTINPSGGGSHTNMQPTTFLNVMLKL